MNQVTPATTPTALASEIAPRHSCSNSSSDNSPLGVGTTANDKSLFEIETQPQVSTFRRLYEVLTKKMTPERKLNVTTNEQGQTSVNTADGYNITFLGEREAWKITAPDGSSTEIWGDPHVKESDGDNWDFHKQSSFIFGDNKITVEVTDSPYPGKTFSKTVTVYGGGDDRMTMTDIHTNNPKYDTWTYDKNSHDQGLDDGEIYKLTSTGKGFEWKKE